jgi:hypothetical protein
VRPEALGKFQMSRHRASNPWPSGLQHSLLAPIDQKSKWESELMRREMSLNMTVVEPGYSRS